MAIHSVSEVTKYIKEKFSRDAALQGILLRGEVSNFKRYPSEHCYFTLKDAGAALKCVMFKSRARYLKFVPRDGMQVIAEGRIEVYERDGVYQLYVDSLAPEGTGALAMAFAQLKEKLTAEGLFAPEHKQPIPPFPRCIGVVTSSAGAVLRDIYRVSKRRFPGVKLALYPVAVQGEGAAEQIAAGIAFFNAKYPVDVLIVGRGGGSLEDLWAFNEEIVVRAIFASKIPVISAVGHETDFTLADFVSDLRAATPSQAAELAVPDRADLIRQVTSLTSRLTAISRRQLEAKRHRLLAASQSFVFTRPERLLESKQQRLDMARIQLLQLAKSQLSSKRHRLDLALKKLDMLSPTRVLRRGYAALEDEGGKPIHSVSQLAVGDILGLILTDGRIRARVAEK
ncbi:MAG: exodeoxyribonuclease VII large subunit [Selenomonadaceae bacterium]|nr:exodeoxyribonuclease VII large subunit [Selenomonadaceae bacterium]